MNIKSMVLELVELLPCYTESRLPYTYHHDYMRSNYGVMFPSNSRAEVAENFKGAEDAWLYSIAFMYLLNRHSATEILMLFDDINMTNAQFIISTAESLLEDAGYKNEK